MFDVDVQSNGTMGTALTQVDFMLIGSLQPGDLANFQLIYYPGGRNKPGVVIASNDGSTWVPGPTSFLNLRLATPLVLGSTFKGFFALLVDVNGSRSYNFAPLLQMVTISVNGTEHQL